MSPIMISFTFTGHLIHQTLNRSRGFASLAGTLFFVAGLMVGGASDAAVPGAKRVDKSTPHAIYHDFCSVCHGDKGDGKSRAQESFVRPPRDFTAPDSKSLPRDFMISIVRDGKPGTAMVGWKTQLNDQQIESVVDYIRATFMGIPGKQQDSVPAVPAQKPPTAADKGPAISAAKPAAADMTLPFPNSLKGDIAKGHDFYMKNCSTCHGTLGDGKGPRAYFINPKPQNFLTVESRSEFNRPALFAAISNGRLGTEMPAWSKVLSDQEIANVAEFVFQQFIQPKAQSTRSEKSSK